VVPGSGTHTSTRDVEELGSGYGAASSCDTVGNYLSSGRINSLRTLELESGTTGFLRDRW